MGLRDRLSTRRGGGDVQGTVLFTARRPPVDDHRFAIVPPRRELTGEPSPYTSDPVTPLVERDSFASVNAPRPAPSAAPQQASAPPPPAPPPPVVPPPAATTPAVVDDPVPGSRDDLVDQFAGLLDGLDGLDGDQLTGLENPPAPPSAPTPSTPRSPMPWDEPADVHELH